MKKLRLTEKDKEHGRTLLKGAFVPRNEIEYEQSSLRGYEYKPIGMFYYWLRETTYLKIDVLRRVIDKCLVAGDLYRAMRIYNTVVNGYDPVGDMFRAASSIATFAFKAAFVAAVFYLLFLAVTAHAQPPPARDEAACRVVELDGFVFNPYEDRRVVALDVELLREEITTARADVDTYLDQTPMPEVDIDAVHSMLYHDIATRLDRMRCIDKDAGQRAEAVLMPWMSAVDRELLSEVARRRYEAACQKGKPKCKATQYAGLNVDRRTASMAWIPEGP